MPCQYRKPGRRRRHHRGSGRYACRSTLRGPGTARALVETSGPQGVFRDSQAGRLPCEPLPLIPELMGKKLDDKLLLAPFPWRRSKLRCRDRQHLGIYTFAQFIVHRQVARWNKPYRDLFCPRVHWAVPARAIALQPQSCRFQKGPPDLDVPLRASTVGKKRWGKLWGHQT